MNERQQEIINAHDLIVDLLILNEIDIPTSLAACLGIVTAGAVKLEMSDDSFITLIFTAYKDFKQLKELQGKK